MLRVSPRLLGSVICLWCRDLFAAPQPIAPPDISYDWPWWLDGGLIVLALLLMIMQIAYAAGLRFAWKRRFSLAPHRLAWMDRFAESLSDPHLIVFDRVSISVLAISVSIFVVCCGAQIHGSATSIWDFHIAGQKPHEGLLWGQPKRIRSDEFNIFTPDIFSQVYSTPAFRSSNHTVGGEQSVLFWAYPVNYPSEIPRFLLWPFHFFKIAIAFSIYWNLKGLVLFGGSYLLLLLLTGSKAWLSAAGACWIYLSGLTQWWFSHCLPEVVAFAALATVAAIYLLLSRRKGLVYTAAFVLLLALLNLSFIFYPAFAVPLIWVMLSVGLGILIEKRSLLFGRDQLKTTRWLLITFVLGLCTLAMTSFIWDTQKTIHLISNTVYPGHRLDNGGQNNLLMLFASVIDSVFTEQHVPKIFSNVCEAANFCLLGLLVVPAGWIARYRSLRLKPLDFLLVLGVAMMALFALRGFPVWLARGMLMSLTTSNRARLGIGIGAVLLLVRYFSHMPPWKPIQRIDWLTALALMLVLIAGFISFEKITGYILPARALAMLAAVNFALLLFGVAGRARPFFLLLLALLVTHNFLINPVARGFEAITNKNLYREVCQIHRDDPTAKWIVFGSFLHIADFLKFCGAEVVNGNKFYPVFEYNNVLDPSHRFIHIWNAYSHIAFFDTPGHMEASYEVLYELAYRVNLDMAAPALDQLGVKYCVLTYQPPAAYRAAVIDLVRDGAKRYWIVRRDLLSATER